MQKNIDRIIKAQGKVLKVFNKMINKLEKHNSKLDSLRTQALGEIEYYKMAADSAYNQINNNQKQVEKLKSFLEK